MRCAVLLLVVLSCGACAAAPSPREPGPREPGPREPYPQDYRHDGSLVGFVVGTLAYAFDDVQGGSGAAGGMEFQIGGRSLPERAFGRARHHLVYGLGFVVPIGESPLALELGVSYSQGNSDYLGFQELEGLLVEGSAGLRLTLGTGAVRPYVGAGLSGIYASLENVAQDSLSNDTAGGTYLHAGLAIQADGGKYLALDWRRVQNVELDSFEGTDGTLYNQLTLVVGINF